MSDAVADLVIISAGPAGMAAACEARALALSVILLDEQATIGNKIDPSVESAPTDRIDVLGPTSCRAGPWRRQRLQTAAPDISAEPSAWKRVFGRHAGSTMW